MFFDTRNAEAITSSGQVAIKFIANRLNMYMNNICKTKDVDYIVAVDTDSNYINFGPLVEMYFDKSSDEYITNALDRIMKEKIEPFINKSYNELSDYMNCFAMEWHMKREVIANSAVFVQKKKYFMSILDDEGVRMKDPKLKVIGLEAVRSSTPEICRNALKSIMKTILLGSESQVQQEVVAFRKEFDKAHVMDICSPRGVTDIEKWLDPKTNKGFKGGTPIGVRGSILFNRTIKDIDPAYETIKSGDKVRFIYLKEPNKFKSNVIALPNELPESLGLDDKIVDKQLQFEKVFLAPVDGMLKPIGWHSEKVNTLSSFFG